MSFQIVQNVKRKGDPSLKKTRTRKSLSYLAIPFRDMKVGDCIILRKELSSEKTVRASLKAATKQGVTRALKLMSIDPEQFVVDWTADRQQIGLWKIK